MDSNRMEALCAEALRELHNDGYAWVPIQMVARRAFELDEGSMARRRMVNKLLGRIGISRSKVPELPRLAQVNTALDDLSDPAGVNIVSTRTEYDDERQPVALWFRLRPLGQEDEEVAE